MILPAQPMYTVTALGTLPECSSNSPQGINAHTQITGTAYFANDRNHSYFWEQGRLVSLGTLGGTQCNASAINDSGQVVGEAEDARGWMLAFVWQDGQMKALDTPGAENSDAADINNKGQIVGSARMADRRYHPLLWDKDGVHDLTPLLPKNSEVRRINDHAQILGSVKTKKGYDALLLDNGKVTRIQGKGSVYCHPNNLNQQGEVVGWCEFKQGGAFVWRSGQMVAMGTLGGESSAAVGINNVGQIVGSADTPADERHACLWQNGTVYDLNTCIPGADGICLESCACINDKGDIVATGTSDGEAAAFLLTRVR